MGFFVRLARLQSFDELKVWQMEEIMPAIASLEDLKAAQKEGVSIYAMRHAICSMRYGNGAG